MLRLRVNTEGVLEGLEEMRAELSPEAILEGRVVLLAEMLGLLVAFIGESLSLRLVREIWPKALPDHREPVNGDNYDKTK
jgi:hypothetical protein